MQLKFTDNFRRFAHPVRIVGVLLAGGAMALATFGSLDRTLEGLEHQNKAEARQNLRVYSIPRLQRPDVLTLDVATSEGCEDLYLRVGTVALGTVQTWSDPLSLSASAGSDQTPQFTLLSGFAKSGLLFTVGSHDPARHDALVHHADAELVEIDGVQLVLIAEGTFPDFGGRQVITLRDGGSQPFSADVRMQHLPAEERVARAR